MNRRGFLRAGIAGLGATAVYSAFGASTTTPANTVAPYVLSAMDDSAGTHYLAALDRSGRILFRLPVPERGHGGCRRPLADEVVMFSRRPGRYFQVVDYRQGVIIRQIEAEQDHHFYGHGVFSSDGTTLYATANHYPSGEGWVLVYDAQRDYQLQGRLAVDGIGPHEIRLHPDGQTLVIALGGIKTHPDYDRLKLNLDAMQPALLLVDRSSGRILQRHEPSHHQLSCRHLDVSREGIVIAGYQFEGPEWETPPLVARLDTAQAAFAELTLPSPVQTSLHNYIASVAIDPASQLVALTAPRGNRAVLLDYISGEYLAAQDIADVAGAMAGARQVYMFTSGLGGVYRGRATRAERIEASNLRWDNHLTLVDPVLL